MSNTQGEVWTPANDYDPDQAALMLLATIARELERVADAVEAAAGSNGER